MDRGLLSADFTVERLTREGRLRVRGAAGLRGLVLRRLPGGGEEQTLGVPVDLLLRADVEVDPDAGDLAVRSLHVALKDMAIEGSADLRGLFTTSPVVYGLKLQSWGLLLERMAALLPKGVLPDEAVLRGPVNVFGSSKGLPSEAMMDVALDLEAAEVLLPYFSKPAGTAAAARFRGQLRGGGIDVEQLGAFLGPFALLLRGRVRSRAEGELLLDTGQVDLPRMLRLVPPIEQAVRRKADLLGAMQVTGRVSWKDGAMDAGMRVAVRRARVVMPHRFSFTDAASASLVVRTGAAPTGVAPTAALGASRAISVEGSFDLSGAGLRVPGMVYKEAGVPMAVSLVAAESEGRDVTLRKVEVRLPGGTVLANGRLTRIGRRVEVNVPRCRLDFARLAAVLPALRQPGLPTGRTHFALQIDGDPTEPGTLSARLSGLDMETELGRLRGRAEVVGLSVPRRVSFDLRGDEVDLDEILGVAKEMKAAAPPRPKRVPNPRRSAAWWRWLRAVRIDGTLRLQNFVARKERFRDVFLAVSLTAGRAEVKTLRGQGFGGTVTLDGSYFDFGTTPFMWGARLRLGRVDTSQLLGLGGPALAEKLKALATIRLQVVAPALGWQKMAPRLRAQAGILIENGVIRNVKIHAKITNKAIAGLMGHRGEINSFRERINLGGLSVRVQARNGQVRIVEPLRFVNDEARARLEGDIGLLRGDLALYGSMDLLPQTIEQGTKGMLVTERPLPVDLSIRGDGDEPLVEVNNLNDTTRALLGGIFGVKKDSTVPLPSRDVVEQQPGPDLVPLPGASPLPKADGGGER